MLLNPSTWHTTIPHLVDDSYIIVNSSPLYRNFGDCLFSGYHDQPGLAKAKAIYTTRSQQPTELMEANPRTRSSYDCRGWRVSNFSSNGVLENTLYSNLHQLALGRTVVHGGIIPEFGGRAELIVLTQQH